MKEFETTGLRYLNGCLEVLDQTMLPQRESWIYVDCVKTMERLIQQLSLRGAPLLGVGAAMCLADIAERGATPAELEEGGYLLAKTRPTAVNLAWAVERLLKYRHEPAALIQEAWGILQEDIEMSEAMANRGAALIEPGEGIITHCNTGGLVSAGVGTALGVLRRAHEQGKDIHVYVDETRPLLQGARLTTWELQKLGVPYTLLCDGMSASLMRSEVVHRALVGADRIALNGDVANKIGTYNLAIAAKYHNAPFHVVAPSSTVDLKVKTGADIDIEQRPAAEVRGVSGAFGSIAWNGSHVEVYNPSFDITPAALVTSIVLDSGVYLPSQIKGKTEN